MTLAGRSKETAYNIITMLTGRGWDLVEDLNIESLAETNGFDLIFDRLDAGFRYDPLTEAEGPEHRGGRARTPRR